MDDSNNSNNQSEFNGDIDNIINIINTTIENLANNIENRNINNNMSIIPNNNINDNIIDFPMADILPGLQSLNISNLEHDSDCDMPHLESLFESPDMPNLEHDSDDDMPPLVSLFESPDMPNIEHDSDGDMPPLEHIDEEFEDETKEDIRLHIQIPPRLPPPPRLVRQVNFQHTCNICGQRFHDEIAVQDHKLIYHENIFNDILLRCNICNITFAYEDDLERHINTVHDGVSQVVEFKCEICNECFSNQYTLGDHILTDHNTYNGLNQLDNDSSTGFFPGFNILDKIGMISDINYNDFKKVYIDDDSCVLCLEKYNFDLVQKCKDDDILYLNNKSNKSKKYSDFKCDIKLLDENVKKVDPYFLNCCKKYLCHDCIYNHCDSSNSLRCAFCYKDHTREDLDYIKYIVEDEIIDKSRWRVWWEKHIDIFL